ncbi:hypothetical protein GALMADRAFT_143457 [Galerina marginata CBS 339.88]|uniref:Uncharacterized protein n=1 Tax=Galerina marginata (strain CBS 339.88) TaxID=685588 RepID=A0A067SZE3_GALM3|nr:hypothetical protein GALMADRAFT_143457 [Galerina marginata CBS 339.88]
MIVPTLLSNTHGSTDTFYLILTPQSSTYAFPQLVPEIEWLSADCLVNLSTKDCNPQHQKAIVEPHSLSTSHPPSPLIPATKSLERALDLAKELSQTENLPLDRIYIAEICPGLVVSDTVHYYHWPDIVQGIDTDVTQTSQEYAFVGHIPASAVRSFGTVKECQGLQVESYLADLKRMVETLPTSLNRSQQLLQQTSYLSDYPNSNYAVSRSVFQYDERTALMTYTNPDHKRCFLAHRNRAITTGDKRSVTLMCEYILWDIAMQNAVDFRREKVVEQLAREYGWAVDGIERELERMFGGSWG